MIDKKEYLKPEHKALADEISKMELRGVPHAFSSSVMDSVRKIHTPWWKRILRWVNSPIELHLTPLRVGLAIALMVTAVFFYPVDEQVQNTVPKSFSVRFEFNAPYGEIKNVSVIGSFNDWSAEASSMRYDKINSVWIYETSLQPGDHEYVFLVNGKTVVPDPNAAYYRKDGFGSVNSIVSVRSSEYEI